MVKLNKIIGIFERYFTFIDTKKIAIWSVVSQENH